MVVQGLNKIRETILEYDTSRNKKYHVRGNAFRVLIGAILSQRTRDQNTDKAAKNLFSVVSKPQDIIKMSLKKLQSLIKPSGFYRTKSENIKKVCEILVSDHNGKVPKAREKLMELPGVGFKTADIVSLYAYGIPTIPVDIHVEMVSKRLGLVRRKAKYEEIRTTLENLFEGDKQKINSGMVEFGQRICLTAKPKCYMCPLVDVCKFEKKNMNVPKLHA